MSAESPLRRKRCRDVEVDELELELQMLRRKNALILEDSQREKEKAARLLSFMEKENEDLRKVNTQFLDTFYEEKVSAQRRLRALELEKERAVEALAAVKKSANDVPLPPPSSMNDDLWMAQIADLQRQNESDRLSYKAQISSLLEEKKDLLKSLSDLRGQRTVGGVSSPLSEQQQHHPQTCVRCAGLERQLEEARREAVRVERRLRSQEVLETKLSSAEMRLRDLGETRREVAELQASLESAQRQADEWSRTLALVIDEGATASSSSSASSEVTPTRVLDFIVNLQRRCVLLKGGVGEAEAECSRLKEKLSQSDQSLAELRASLCQRERALLEAEQLAASAQRNLALYEREVLSLRGILKSYEAESRLGKTSTGSVDAHKDEMITSLRADLDVLRTKLKEREAPVEPTKGPNYEDALRRLETQVAHLKEATGLDFVPQETRVLHLLVNPSTPHLKEQVGADSETPSSLPLDQVKHLTEEVGRLRRQLSSVASDISGERLEDRSLVANNDSSFMTGAALGSVDSTKVNARLKEIFKEKISSYREAVYLLTGFKIDLHSAEGGAGSQHPRLRLRSVYAERPEDSLIFQWTESTSLELLETPFISEHVDRKLLALLRSSNSIPAFLASVTLDLFEKQTIFA